MVGLYETLVWLARDIFMGGASVTFPAVAEVGAGRWPCHNFTSPRQDSAPSVSTEQSKTGPRLSTGAGPMADNTTQNEDETEPSEPTI